MCQSNTLFKKKKEVMVQMFQNYNQLLLLDI